MMMLEYAKVPYSYANCKEYFGKSWPEAKQEKMTLYGYLPLLVVDGETKINQSGAINRYIAELTGCAPTDPLTKAKCDQVCDRD